MEQHIDNKAKLTRLEGCLRDSASQTEAESGTNHNNNSNNDENRDQRSSASYGGIDVRQNRDRSESASRGKEFQLGPRIRGRSQRRATNAVSAISAPSADASNFETDAYGSPGRPMVQRGRSPASPGRSNARSVGNLNGVADMMEFQDTMDGDGSTHRAGSLSLPSATWTPPSLRHFGFPSEFKGFLEVNFFRFVSPWAEKVWSVLKEDFQQFPQNWKSIPNGRRVAYVVVGFVSCYYFIISLYAIPLVAIGFLTPAYICRKYLENDGNESSENGNNEDVDDIIVSVKEMSQWMKFWVSFSGWLLAASLAPRILSAILPINVLTLLFVIASLVIPWPTNPAVFLFDRLLLPLFHWSDGLVASYKEKIMEAVSTVELRNKRRRS